MIPELEFISVRIDGAVVNPLDMQLPRGTRLFELRGKIQLTKEADERFMKRRRLLKNGEIIHVPKNVE
jgi:hypothetical protein